MSNQIKFTLSQFNLIQETFNEKGYVVIENAIDQSKINFFLSSYNKIKKNPFFIYFSQSTHVGIRPKIDQHGHIVESMQNASCLGFFREFSRSIQTCLYHDNVAKALSAISGAKEHISWQNMFFDKSTGTIEHQDSWYIDTEPAGHLIGVWYALEDIQLDSGPFFVVPGSHKIGLLDRNKLPSHEQYVEAVKDALLEIGDKKVPMLLKKGDILLWHPYLIHGAFQCSNNEFSRKSFTSHFYPSTFQPKDTEKGKFISIYDHKNPRDTECQGIKTAYRFNNYIYNFMVYLVYLKDKILLIKKNTSMRREDYV